MNKRPVQQLARRAVGAVLVPACAFLLACSGTPSGSDPAGAGTTGAGGHPSGGSHSGGGASPGGAGSFGAGGAGNSAGASGGGSLGGAGGALGGSGNISFGGASGNANGGAGGKTSGGGASGAGGKANGGAGGKANGGAAGAVAGSAGSAGASALNCSAAMPSGGTQHTSKNQSGKAAGLDWTIWSNGPTAGSITTYDAPAFSAAWNDSSDFLARLGLQWNASKTYDQLGTITAQFAAKKNGTGGGYSYIGIYGWSVSPCVEWYIVDDSYNKMPVNPGTTTKMGTAVIDDGTYTLYKRSTNGTGGSKCGSQTTWDQYYSIRNTGRSCGQISITEHFKAWAAANMPLGKMDQAQILVEVGGGTGSVDFPVASVTATP